jgi:hypothetical protein
MNDRASLDCFIKMQLVYTANITQDVADWVDTLLYLRTPVDVGFPELPAPLPLLSPTFRDVPRCCQDLLRNKFADHKFQVSLKENNLALFK